LFFIPIIALEYIFIFLSLLATIPAYVTRNIATIVITQIAYCEDVFNIYTNNNL